MYGFNGKEMDNEVKGNGNSYDFGARIYDPRIGRWLSVDPYERLYVPISPYTFALNNPIKLVDADGNVVVDDKGNPVTITVTKNEDGSYSATFGFVEGTDQQTIDNFNLNGGRLVSTLIQVPTGREMVDKAVSSQDDIHIIISPENKLKTETKDGKTSTKGKLGGTKLTFIKSDFSTGEVVKVGLEVTVYEGSINKATELNGVRDYTENNLTQDQKLARTGAHELEHATNPVDVQANIENRELTKSEHQVARGKGNQVAKEFGEKNKKK